MERTPKTGFTLIELMITVSIIGLLAVLALPRMLEAGNRTKARRFAREIQAAGHAFVRYSFDHGDYPADRTPAQMPEGMAGYLSRFPWTETTLIGGQWDWDNGQFGTRAGVSVYRPEWNDDRMADIDEVLDDGNLATGHFRRRTGGYIYVLEE